MTGSLAHSTATVIAARAVMGVGAAMIMPATLSLLTATFPRRERARAITLWTATSGLAIAAGPLLAGRLLESHAWGFTFLINVPVAGVAVLAALALVPPSRAAVASRLDLVGGLLSIVFLASLVYMIIEGPRFGWGAAAIGAAVLAGLGLAGFVAWELRHPRPLLDVRRFTDRAFAGANLAVTLFFLAAFGSIYYLTQHLQFVLGYGPLATGVRLLPLAGAVFAGAAVTGVLTPRAGMKVTVIVGMALGTAGILLLTRVGDGSGYGDFLAPLLLLGLAIGLSVSPCTDAIMGAFPEKQLGVGGAVNDTSLELGGSLGIAILGSILAGSYTSGIDAAVGGRLPARAATRPARPSAAPSPWPGRSPLPGRPRPSYGRPTTRSRTPSRTPAWSAASSSAPARSSSPCCCPAGAGPPPRARPRTTCGRRCPPERPQRGEGPGGPPSARSGRARRRERPL